MNSSLLIEAPDLYARMQNIGQQPVIFDVQHDLMKPEFGIESYRQAHLPNAFFWSMEADAVATKTGKNGRHPLPSRNAVLEAFAKFGVSDQSTVVAYDAQGGMYAARLWWLLKWIGHDQVFVLNGGLGVWVAHGFGTANGPPSDLPNNSGALSLRPSQVGWSSKSQIAAISRTRASTILDARAAPRYSGETETIDPVAGHIPGAINRFFQQNLLPDGRFKGSSQLKEEFNELLGDRSANEIIHQCGSGVTACHNLIAMELAGLRGSSLYPGSWSEWCQDTSLPVAKGQRP